MHTIFKSIIFFSVIFLTGLNISTAEEKVDVKSMAPDTPSVDEMKPDVPDAKSMAPDTPSVDEMKPDVPDAKSTAPDVPNAEDLKPEVTY